MESNNFKEKDVLDNHKFITEQQESAYISGAFFHQALTNEQKLEYLTKLIQDTEQSLESNGIEKKLVRKNDDLN